MRWLVPSIIILLLIEPLAQLTYLINEGSLYDRANLAESYRIDAADDPSDEPKYLSWQISHPYLGYVGNKPDSLKFAQYQGFSDLPKDATIVLVVGGSVAKGNAYHIEKHLNRLAKEHGFQKRFVVFRAALEGYKQPQQLMTLVYFLSLGARIDLVINLDGCNDIVIPLAENYRNQVAYSFPRSWHLQVSRSWDAESLRLIARSESLADEASTIIARSRTLLGRSALFGTYATLMLNANRHQTYAIHERLQEISTDKTFEMRGPPNPKRADVLEASADLWLRSSILMNDISQASGMHYVHVLQPNQYVKGSKVFSSREKKIAYKPSSGYGVIAQAGYPTLLSRTKILKDKLDHFLDTTMIFSDVREDIYADSFCHFTQRGKDILSSYIATYIVKHVYGSD